MSKYYNTVAYCSNIHNEGRTGYQHKLKLFNLAFSMFGLFFLLEFTYG